MHEFHKLEDSGFPRWYQDRVSPANTDLRGRLLRHELVGGHAAQKLVVKDVGCSLAPSQWDFEDISGT